MPGYRPGTTTLRRLATCLAAALLAVLLVRADRADAWTCRQLPEARTIEDSLNRFWGISAKLCQADELVLEAGANPGEGTIEVNRRWLNSMSRRYGDWAVAGILAHEWGHMVQNRPQGTAAELQADCLAGAFMRAAGFGETDVLRFAELSFQNGDLEWSPYGHGTGIQREKAVLQGYRGFNSRQGGSLDRLCPFDAA
jgi:hypothetical protein